MTHYTTLLLDADETLLDFSSAERSAFFKTMADFSITADDTHYRRYSAINDEEWKRLERGETTKPVLVVDRFTRFLSEFNLSGDAKTINERYLLRLGEGCDLIPGAYDFLTRAAEKYTLYLVTNGTASVQRRRLADAKIFDFFKDIFISEEIGYAKPEREYFTHVLAHIDEKDTAKVLVIGDSLTSDIKGGLSVGLDTCLFCRYNNKEECRSLSTYTVCGFDVLCALLAL